jgi:hypothetical protein
MTMRIMVGVFETPHVFPNRMAGGGLYADQESGNKHSKSDLIFALPSFCG